jgi:hypothetical protein
MFIFADMKTYSSALCDMKHKRVTAMKMEINQKLKVLFFLSNYIKVVFLLISKICF